MANPSTTTIASSVNPSAVGQSVRFTAQVRSNTTTALTTSLNPAFTAETVTLTATVTGVGGTPSGSVVFKDGATTIATSTLVAGVATAAVSFAGGIHALTAVYQGDINYQTSTGALTQNVYFTDATINPTTQLADGSASVSVTVSLRNELNAALVGVPITFTLSLTSNVGGDTITPGLTVNTNGSGLSVFVWKTSRAFLKTVVPQAYGRNIPQQPTCNWYAGNPHNATSTITPVPTSLTADGVAICKIVIVLRDPNFNPCASRSVTLTASGTGNTLVSATPAPSGSSTWLTILDVGSGFNCPAPGVNTPSLLVTDSTWAIVGELVFVGTQGPFFVASKPDSTHIILTNIITGTGVPIDGNRPLQRIGCILATLKSTVAEVKTVTATIVPPTGGGPTFAANVTFT